MWRRKVESWEPEARDECDRLHDALSLLGRQEEAYYSGSANDEEFFGALSSAGDTSESVLLWSEEWRVRTATLKTSRDLALSVYRSCLPPLLDAVDLYAQSLVILAMSPDLATGDGNLAATGIEVAKDVSSVALRFLGETPKLRAIDRAAVEATLKGLDIRVKPMLALAGRIGSRAAELRGDGGY
ncbi:MAG: hypothetical protein ABSC90_07910 [Acidimicrobiales bacterium]|jgi:hypothetical protein